MLFYTIVLRLIYYSLISHIINLHLFIYLLLNIIIAQYQFIYDILPFLFKVHRGTKFSCRFTLQEIQQRWYALLYDSAISRVAVQAMRNLHPELIASVQARTLYSKAEEDLLGTIKSVSINRVFTLCYKFCQEIYNLMTYSLILLYHIVLLYEFYTLIRLLNQYWKHFKNCLKQMHIHFIQLGLRKHYTAIGS